MGIKGYFWVLRIDYRWYNDTEVIAMGTRSYCLSINDTQVYVGVHKNSMKIMFTDAAGNE